MPIESDSPMLTPDDIREHGVNPTSIVEPSVLADKYGVTVKVIPRAVASSGPSFGGA